MMEETVRAYCAANALLPENGRVLCAVSGGADSVCLLHLLAEMPELTVVCAHYNHRLRGAESDRDEAFVRALCDRLGLPCVTGSGDVAALAAEQRLSLETAARTLRYAFLEETAAQWDCGAIATAHNAEDNAETVLMHLLRGSGLKGLCGIPPKRGRIIRPLLPVSRVEIEDYLARWGLSHVEDSSNAGDDFTRNRIRHRVLPLLAEENPGAVKNIGAAAALLQRDEAYLSDCAARFLAAQPERGAVSISALLALPEAVGSRVLRQLCGEVERGHIEAVYALCRNRAVHGETDLPGLRVVKDYDRLRFAPPVRGPIPRQELPMGECRLPDAGWTITCTEGIFHKEVYNSFNTFYFNREKLCGRIYVASRSEGDRIRLVGRNCTKTVKRLFSEAALPLDERLRIPVLSDDAGVIGVYGFGMAQRCVPQAGEPILCVRITE